MLERLSVFASFSAGVDLCRSLRPTDDVETARLWQETTTEARKLLDDADRMLDKLIADKWLTARGVLGLWPANSVGEDVEVYLSEVPGAAEKHAAAAPIGAYGTPSHADAASGTPGASPSEGLLATLSFLRQQADKPPGRPNLCLADFVAPKASGKTDYIGAFAVTTGIGIEPHVAAFEEAGRVGFQSRCGAIEDLTSAGLRGTTEHARAE